MKHQDDSQIATTWNTTPRTVRRWRAAGAPFKTVDAMRRWLASRKHVPQGTAVMLAAMRTTDAKTSAELPPGPVGAAQALKRLEAAEAKSYQTFVAAVSSGDPISIKSSRESWLRISESLRRFDLSVERTRREAGLLVPRAETEEAVAMLMNSLRIGYQQCSYEIASQLTALSPPDAIGLLRKVFDNRLLTGLASALAMTNCPAWLRTALTKDSCDVMSGAAEKIRQREDMLREAFRVSDEAALRK